MKRTLICAIPTLAFGGDRGLAKKLHGSRGFSLLEMIVALAIAAVIIAFATPSMFRNLQALEFAAEHDSVLREIRALRGRALLEQRVFAFPPEGENTFRDLRVPPPVGWIAEGEPIYFLETGICLGGEITISNGKGRIRTTVFAAPDCAIAPASSAP